MKDLSTYSYHMQCILKVLIYIDEHLGEELVLEKLAKIAHISPCYFHRLFSAYTGETLGLYIKRLRLEKAAEKLQYSDKPITDIALDSGYENSSSFNKVFNQVMGQSPSRYRKTLRPLILAIMERTLSKNEENTMIQPEYVYREEEEVLFVRQMGDYNKTPGVAFSILGQFLEREHLTSKVKACYGMALDDPNIADRSKCRFDAAVALSTPVVAKGEVGKKVLPNGRFAVFTHIGPYGELENTFTQIFLTWYPHSKEKLADYSPFCEFMDLFDEVLPPEQHRAKIYIPLKG